MEKKPIHRRPLVELCRRAIFDAIFLYLFFIGLFFVRKTDKISNEEAIS